MKKNDQGEIEITPEELRELYENNLNKVVCEKLECTTNTLVSLLKEHNIPLKNKGNREKKHKIKVIG